MVKDPASMSWDEIWSKLSSIRFQKDRSWRAEMLTIQAGDFLKATAYQKFYEGQQPYLILKGNVKNALADLVSQIFMYCAARKIKFEELEVMGKKQLMDFIKNRTAKKNE